MTDLDRGKDFEPDIYATHEEDYDDFDVEEEEEGGSRAAIILLVVIGVVLLLGVAYVSYRMGYENGQREASVPRLAASAEGGKVQPENPGGLAPPQESALDENLTSEGENEFAQLLPNEEQVIELPNEGGEGDAVPGIEVPETIGVDPDLASEEAEEAPDSVPVEATPSAQPESEPAETPAPAPDTSSRLMVPKPGSSPSGGSSSGSSASGSESVPSPSASVPPSSSVPSPSASTIPAPTPSAPSGSAPGAGMTGDYVIQLASLPSQDAANAAWRNTSAKYSDLLDGAVPDFEEADLGERGVFYRLRVGYFESRTDANRLCETLKSRGQDCLVKSR